MRSVIHRPPWQRLLDDPFTAVFGTGETLRSGAWVPALDISETPEEYAVTMEIPGVDPGDVDISFEENTLTLRGEKKHEREVKEESYYRAERSFGRFERSLRVPSNIQVEKITASCRDGVLRVTLPKKEEAKPRRISVAAE